jgi:hypothetical protein
MDKSGSDLLREHRREVSEFLTGLAEARPAYSRKQLILQRMVPLGMIVAFA